MHICLKCTRIAKTVDEIENGCPCGSKVFVYKRDDLECKCLEPIKTPSPSTEEPEHSKAPIFEEEHDEEPGHEYNEVWLSKGAEVSKITTDEETNEPKIENVRQIKRGIFEVDLLGLKNGPLVIRDKEGVYYVRLPFEQNEPQDV